MKPPLIFRLTVSLMLFLGLVVLALSSGLGGVGGVGGKRALAQEPRVSIRGSDLPIPRFVSLKSNTVNMRVGPGMDYPIKWQYHRQGLPLKVIGEFEVWRKVEDHTGEQGWMHVSTLGGDRNALVLDGITPIHRRGNANAPIIAVAEGGVIFTLEQCRAGWCRIAHTKAQGWIERKALWGILPGETLN